MRLAFVHHPFGPAMPRIFRPKRVAPARPARATGQPEAALAPVDVVDQGDRFALKVDLPGVGRDDISVAVEGARVAVSGTRRAPSPEAGKAEQIRVLRAERPAANYARTVELPAEVDGDAAEARLENGVLTLTLPKRRHLRQITVR